MAKSWVDEEGNRRMVAARSATAGMQESAVMPIEKAFSSVAMTGSIPLAIPSLVKSSTDPPDDETPHARTLLQPKPARIAIKIKGKITFNDPADVIAVEAKGSYVLLHLKEGSHMLRGYLSMMEKKLAAHGLVRIHRSVLVNAALVEEIQPLSAGEYLLRMKGGREYRVTRTYKKSLHLLAQSWIGTEGFVT